MECMLNYIGAFISLLSISFILLLCFCWNKKQSLIQKGSNSHHDVSVKSCQKTNHIDHKRFISRCKQLYRNDCNASVTVSNDFKPNHILIETSNLVTNESDLAYATTIELRENLNNRKIIPPGYQLLRQESNSHRNCELPPVPTYSNTNFTENKQTKSSNDESKNILEDTSDQLMYYSVQTVKRSIENDQHLYDIAIPVLRPNKSRTGTFELNNQFLYSLCDDQASDSDGLYASVSHPLSNNDEEALRNNMRRTSMNTKINSRLHNDINETNGSTQRRCEFCQSPYYSQLKDDSDVNSSDKNRTITTTSTAVVSTTDTIQFTELPTGISIDNDATTINNISCECHSSKQSTSYLLRKVDDFDKYSTNPPSYSFGHLYAQVTPRIKSRQTVNCPETASDSSVYSSNYTRPPIPARGYDQTDIDLVNQIRNCSQSSENRNMESCCKILAVNPSQKNQINVTGSTSLQSDGLLLTNSRCNDDTGGISSIHPLMTNCQLDSNYRYISVRESLANLRARNALPILYNIIKRDHNQPYHSFDDSDTNQESSDYERIYPVTSTESTILVNCINTGLTSLSGGKQNTETSLCDKQLEHSYTELSGSNHDSGAYAQVYSTISTDSILTTTEPSNPFSHIVNSHPSGDGIIVPKDFSHNNSGNNSNNLISNKSEAMETSVSAGVSPSSFNNPDVDAAIYNVPKLLPNSSNSLNDRMLAEIQAFRHMDSELDLTQSAKTLVTDIIKGDRTCTINSVLDEYNIDLQGEHVTEIVSLLNCQLKPNKIVNTGTISSKSQINNNPTEVSLMTSLMEEYSSTNELSSSSSSKIYGKQLDCKNKTIDHCTPLSSSSLSSSLYHSSILSPSSLCKSIKSPLVFSVYDLHCNHTTSCNDVVIINTGNQYITSKYSTLLSSSTVTVTAPFAYTELTCISDLSTYDDIDNLSLTSTFNKSTTTHTTTTTNNSTTYYNPTKSVNNLSNGGISIRSVDRS